MTAPRELLDTAKAVRKNAYSPYSKVKVGAALRTRDGKIFSGCNVENSSYGATVCAERVAIQKAVSELGGKIEIQELVVVTDATPPWTPCGICRQVIAEFGSNSTIHSCNEKGDVLTSRFDQLYPQAFTPAHLGK